MRISSIAGLMLPALVILSTRACAQLGPWPSWADPDDFVLQYFATHPALGNVGEGLKQTVFDETTSTNHGSYVVHSHPLHGQLGVSEAGGALLGSLSTGLQYVLHVRSVTTSTAGPNAPAGLVVAGVLASGRSRALFTSWDGTTAPAAASFSPIGPDSPIGEVFLLADVVGTDAYVINGVARSITRYYDSDLDGVPDALDPVSPALLDQFPWARSIRQFYSTDSGEVGVLCARSSHRRHILCVVSDTSGALGLSFRIYGNASSMPTPHLYGHPPVEGLNHFRIRHKVGEKVWVTRGSNRVSKTVLIDDPRGYELVPLLYPVQDGETVVVESSDGLSRSYVVVAKRQIVLQGEPTSVTSGKQFELVGGNFDGTDIAVSISVDGGPYLSTPVIVVNSDKLVLTAPMVTSEKSSRVRIKVEKPSDPDGSRCIKPIWVDPEPAGN